MVDYLFETSWEVCNKVGGIYAVLSTKASTLRTIYGDKVVFIGPDLGDAGAQSQWFVEGGTPLDDWARTALLPDGITVRAGRWQVPGNPISLLVGFRCLDGRKHELYAEMWERYGVDSLHAYGDYDEACTFAWAAARVLCAIVATHRATRVVAHFDEWTTGMGLLWVKTYCPQAATVFTTHATSIGRSICGNGKPLYDHMTAYNGDQMAAELNMQSKHSLEKAAAHAAHAFTTVSKVTARECAKLLEREPIVTPNGFEAGFVPRGRAYTVTRERARKRLMAMTRALTGVDYAPDTMLVGTAGRCEFRNKGIDAYLDALNVARTTLAERGSKRRLLAFVLVPSWTDGPRADLQQAMATAQTTGLPMPQVSHTMHPGYDDPVLGKMRAIHFANSEREPLHVIDVPCYLNGDDGVLDMTYYDLLCGLDLTVFPSYYEPWGYTPHESVAFGVPTVTTTLAGFGQWVLDEMGREPSRTGVSVLHRTDSNYHDTVHALAERITTFHAHSASRVTALRRSARATAANAQWSNFITHYTEAYRQALIAAGLGCDDNQ